MKKMNKRLLFALMAMLCLSGAPAWADDTDVALRCALLLIKEEDYKKAFLPCKQSVGARKCSSAI